MLTYALPKIGHPNCRRPDKVIDGGHVRHIIAKAALDDIFDRLCTIKSKPAQNIPVAALLRMVA